VMHGRCIRNASIQLPLRLTKLRPAANTATNASCAISSAAELSCVSNAARRTGRVHEPL
jgi:hypothetical protein